MAKPLSSNLTLQSYTNWYIPQIYMHWKRNQRLQQGMKSHGEALACLVFWQKLLSCRFYSNHDLKLKSCMLTYFYRKLEVAGTITTTLNCLVRVLLRNSISHSYFFVLSSKDIDGQCGDLSWVFDLTLTLWLGAECHCIDSIGYYEGLYFLWSPISFF